MTNASTTKTTRIVFTKFGEIVGASEDSPKSVDLMKKFLEDNKF